MNMKKHATWCLAAALAIAAAAGCKSSGGGHEEDEKHEKISQTALPQAVRDGFSKAYPGATIEEVEKETYGNGTVHYEIKYRGADGKTQDVELNTDGEVLEAH
jgi:hypothetical protein